MDDALEVTMLYDFYGELLTKNQRRTFEEYYMYDCSLKETAENLSVSPQAVSDVLIRVKKKLYDYEKKVGFMAFYQKMKNNGCVG